MPRWKRSFRTPTSERLVAFRGPRAVATVDLHYLDTGRIAGMVVFDESAGWSDELVADLLAALNEDMIPHAAASGKVDLTTVIGRLAHASDPEPSPGPAGSKGGKGQGKAVKGRRAEV